MLALSGVLLGAALIGTALSPYLLVKSPLLLVAISAAPHHVALAAASVEPGPLIAVATLRRVLTAVGAYGVGYVYGSAVLEWVRGRYPRFGRFIDFVERLFARRGVALLAVAPAQTLALLAGSARSPFLSFVLAVMLGHALWNGLTYYLGDALSHLTDRLTAFLGEHLFESTLVCVIAVGAQQASARWLRRSRALAARKEADPT